MLNIEEKANQDYWNSVWDSKNNIQKVNIKSYKMKSFHSLYLSFLKVDQSKSLCEIGCSMSSYLLYFHDNFSYTINGFDYEAESVKKTQEIYNNMNYDANIFHHDLFASYNSTQYDVLTSFGVFEHFTDLENTLSHTKKYLIDEGVIITVIPNMNGIIGILQKTFNKSVYDIHIPYTKEEIQEAHESNGYTTLFCDYYGLFTGGVVNLNGVKYRNFLGYVFAIPSRVHFILNKITEKIFSKRLDSKYVSSYIVYIGKKNR